MTSPVLAIDIGGTKTEAGVVSDGSLSPVHTVPTPAASGPAAVLSTTWAVGQAALKAHRERGGAEPAAMGVSSAGVIDPVEGSVVSATEALPGWAGTNLVRELENRSGLAARALNDVHAHGLGEATHGHGRGRGSMLLVAVGTGLGGAYVVDGRVLTGAHHLAGHLGHLPSPEADGMRCSCGRLGHLEAVASGAGLARCFAQRWGDQTGHAPLSGRQVLEAAHDDQHPAYAVALEVTRRAGTALGRVIGGLLNTLDPEVVVLAGGVTSAGPRWHEAVREGVSHDAMDLLSGQPVLSAGAPHAALLGAAQWALGE